MDAAPAGPPAYAMSDGMVDLARLGRRTDTYASGPLHPAPPPRTHRTLPTPPPTRTAPTPRARARTRPTPRRRRPRARPAAAPVVPHHAARLLPPRWSALALYLTGDGRPHFGGPQIVIAGALTVVACGLFLGAWFGRDRKLVLVGAIMSLALAATSIAGNAVRREENTSHDVASGRHHPGRAVPQEWSSARASWT